MILQKKQQFVRGKIGDAEVHSLDQKKKITGKAFLKFLMLVQA
jgi:hypothetical protein